MSKEKKETKYNMHHICPSSRWGITNDINCEMIKQSTHQAIHTLFSNEIFPEQIVRLANLSAKALRPEVVSQLMEVLERRDMEDPEAWYKPECLRIPKHRFYK